MTQVNTIFLLIMSLITYLDAIYHHPYGRLSFSRSAYDNTLEGQGLYKAAMLAKTAPLGSECLLAECPRCNTHALSNCPVEYLQRDKCNCCDVCPVQEFESCSSYNGCDKKKGLACINGTCQVPQSVSHKSCYLDTHIYEHGQSFNISCTMTCTCMDGYLACNPRCEMPDVSPMKGCQEPIFYKRRHECCKHWICLDQYKNKNSTNYSMKRYNKLKQYAERDPETQNRKLMDVGPMDHAYDIAVVRKMRKEDGCMLQSSNWTECSRVCGWGVSERINNDNPDCKMVREVRLCQTMPCTDTNLIRIDDGNDSEIIRLERSNRDMDTIDDTIDSLETVQKKVKKCTKIRRSQQRVRFQFDGCMSERRYKPRYCGTCSDHRCCTPTKTKTVDVNFVCEHQMGQSGPSRFIQKMAIIRACKCRSQSCTKLTLFSHTGVYMGNDIYNENGLE